jgi:hypothetical protein
MTARPPSSRYALSAGEAVDDSPTLHSLLAAHRRAQACLARIAPVLAAGLRDRVRAGPIDGSRWTLLVDNGAAAAKLRQAVPAVLAAAQVAEPAIDAILIRVSPRDGR